MAIDPDRDKLGKGEHSDVLEFGFFHDNSIIIM